MYRVDTDEDFSKEVATLEEAIKIFEDWKDDLMVEGVVESETYVEILESEDDFENHKIIKKVLAVIDQDRTELRTPREEGFDWDYWAKWQEMDNS